jgi:hypothetical protein
MRKRTSRSASATRKTSSRSGTSAATGATGKKPPKNGKDLGKFGFIVEQIREMTSDEFHESLIDAGIIDRNGRLTSKYKPKKK